MPYCTNCGEQYKEGDKFCPGCGKPTQDIQKDKEDNQIKTPETEKKEISTGIQIGILTMTISVFVAIIAFLSGNRGVGFGGLKFMAVGFIIFVIAKWKNRKALIVSASVIVVLIVSSLINSAWQNRNVEIKQVTGKQCKICKTIIVADTTTIEKKYMEVKDKKFLYSYTETLCSACKSEGVKFFNGGKTQYYKGNYSLAVQKFKDAKLREYQDATSWLNKANKALQDKKAKELAEAQKILRKKYENLARKSFLDQGWDIKVYVHGPNYTYITLTWPLMGDVFVHNFEKSDMFTEIYNLGFRRVYYKDGYEYSKYTYWKK
jgi:hypothetical protein